MQDQSRTRLVKALDALSQLLNVIIFNGDENYSISADSYRYNRKYMMLFANLLFLNENHCKEAYLNDVDKARHLLLEVDNGGNS